MNGKMIGVRQAFDKVGFEEHGRLPLVAVRGTRSLVDHTLCPDESGAKCGTRMMVICAIMMVVVGCGPLSMTIGTGPTDRALSSTTLDIDQGANQLIAVIDVSGLMHNTNRTGLLTESDNPVSVFHEKLEKARKDTAVRGVILRLNTPGGTVTASDVMYREVLRFKQRSGKPVVALMMDVAASGGYYLACSTDKIVAYPTTVTGSIGVIMQTMSFKPALDRLGIKAEAITSGPNKAAGSPFSEMTDERRAVLQGLVDDFYGRFVEVVKESRPGISEEDFAMVTDGRVVSGEDALELGLVDQVGDFYDAFLLAKELAGMKKAKAVIYHRWMGYVGSPYASHKGGLPGEGGGIGTQINLAQINLPNTMMGSPAGFYYLWTLGE